MGAEDVGNCNKKGSHKIERTVVHMLQRHLSKGCVGGDSFRKHTSTWNLNMLMAVMLALPSRKNL